VEALGTLGAVALFETKRPGAVCDVSLYVGGFDSNFCVVTV